ncbi:MAG: DegT/DnrJ/EryC1/StrS family aminotransferase [Bacteroidales bacterium]|nr:DegT/DnrJ/EryC1/StrS family aminotransferase [Bacteroidales bacterium]
MSYKIPLFDLNFDGEEEKAVTEVIRSKWISSGPRTKALEEKFATMLEAEQAVALTNCTVSLHLAMHLIGIQPGDEVICPSLTFVATCNAIRYVNAVPVFADVKSTSDLTMDPADIEGKITPRTRAIVVMHFGGFPCNMDRIMELADRYKLKVIEDACHGPLSEYKGKKLGTIADIGCFSFFSNKNISTGEGGMLLTNNTAYAERARLLRSHGMTSMSYERSKGHSTSYDVVDLGFNYRMDDIRASIGLVQLDKLQADINKRAEIRKLYLERLKNFDGITIPFAQSDAIVSNYIFTIVLKDSTVDKRDEVRGKLAEAGIQTSVHYPAVHRFSIFREFSCSLPLTEYVSDNLITLPMYSRLSEDDIEYIVSNLKSILHD